MRVRAAENLTPQLTWEIDIGGVDRAPSDLVRAFRPKNGSTDYCESSHNDPPDATINSDSNRWLLAQSKLS
jgi:hypothetical protein